MMEEASYCSQEKAQSRTLSGQKVIQAPFLDSVLENNQRFRKLEDANKPVQLGLKLQRVYGCAFNIRNSAYYLHEHAQDGTRGACHRKICYLASRYVVISDPETSSQQCYTQHQAKVTTLAVHPSEPLVASASGNEVHVWSLAGMKIKSKLVSSSTEGIILLRFSRQRSEGEHLAVCGLVGQKYCLEIFSWKHERLLASAVLGPSPVFDLSFNPSRPNTLALTGYGFVSLWTRQGSCLSCELEVVLDKEFTCMEYLVINISSTMQEADLMLGTSFGEIFLCLEGKIVAAVESAHTGPVNCISLANFKSKDLVLTAGEDGFICMWSTALKPINKVHLSSVFNPMLSNLKQLNISNFRVDQCYVEAHHVDKPGLTLLSTTRGGAVVEVTVSKITSGDDISVKFNVLFEGHSQELSDTAKVLIALHPEHALMVSVGDDRILKLWNYDTHTLIVSKQLDAKAKPSALQFSRFGMLAVGMDNGILVLLISKDPYWGVNPKSSTPELAVVTTTRELASAVLCIEFSPNDEFMAVSYDNIALDKSTRVDDASGKADMSSGYVMLYRQAEFGDGYTYQLYSRVVLPFSSMKDIGNYPLRSECAVTAMEFSRDGAFLGMLNQRVRQKQHIPNDSDHRPLLIVWNVISGDVIENFGELRSTNWHKLIVLGLLYSTVQINSHRLVQVSSASTHTPLFAGMIGSADGSLHAFRLNRLFMEYQKLTSDRLENISEGLDLYSISRTQLAHSGPVVQCVFSRNEALLFTTAIGERVILQWQVRGEEKNWDYDYLGYLIPSDPFKETLSRDQFYRALTEVWTPRRDLKREPNEEIHLKVQSVMGRRAYDRRNNLFYESQDRIIYSAGPHIILRNRDKNQLFLGDFAAEEFNSEISCLTLGADRRVLAFGTSEVECRVQVWDLCAYIMLMTVRLQDCCQVLLLRLSSDLKLLLVVCLSKDYRQEMKVISLSQETPCQVVASAVLSEICPFKVKDAIFLERDGIEVVTSGIQHLAFWKLEGKSLSYSIAHLEGETDSIRIAFLCVVYLREVVVTAGDDGKLYVWRDLNLVKSVAGHEGSILSVSACEELSVLVTGGVDGHIIVWKLLAKQSTFGYLAQLDVTRKYSLVDPEGNPATYAIQGVCISQVDEHGTFNVLIGTQSGDAWELHFEENADDDYLSEMMKASDHQVLVAMSVDATSSLLFTLSDSGQLCVWSLQNLSQVTSKSFGKPGVNVICFHTKQLLLLAFEQEVVVLSIPSQLHDHRQLEIIPAFIVSSRGITEVQLSLDEQVLAIASSPDQKPQVDLYYVTSEGFVLEKNLFGFRSAVTALDFSTDGFYLMCEDVLGDALLFELETQNIANLHTVEFDIEWCHNGLKHSAAIKAVHQNYRGNKVLCMARNSALSVVAVGDMLGSLRVFHLPHLTGQPMMTLLPHNYKISKCCFTKDHSALLTYSESDHSLIKWSIKA
jgi:WD40 repeat protein